MCIIGAIVAMELDKEKEQELIGRLLAQGLADQQIVEEFVKIGYEKEDACSKLRTFFDNWQTIADLADSSDQQRLLNWHVLLRHKLLQTAIEAGQVTAALQILESLAKLQGLVQVVEAKVIPLAIELVPKEKEKNNAGSDPPSPSPG